MRKSAIAVAVCAVLHAAPSLAAPAVADRDLAAARLLFHDAEGDEQAGRWADALTKLRRASTVKMTPGLRFHIALCEERTGQLVAALNDFTAAQAAARAEDNREVLGLVSDPLLAIKVRVPTLTIDVPAAVASDPHLEVRVDGALLSNVLLGAPIPVDVGSHTIQAAAPGRIPYAVTVTLVERQAEAIRVELAPAIPVPAPAASPPSSTEAPGRGSRTLAIAATVGAAVLVVGGIGAYAAAGSDQSYWRNACHGESGCGNALPVRAWDATALTAWVIGAGAGVAAVVLWTRPTAMGGSSAELRAGPGSVSLAGRF